VKLFILQSWRITDVTNSKRSLVSSALAIKGLLLPDTLLVDLHQHVARDLSLSLNCLAVLLVSLDSLRDETPSRGKLASSELSGLAGLRQASDISRSFHIRNLYSNAN